MMQKLNPKKIVALAFALGCTIALALFLSDAARTERKIVWSPGETSTWIDPLYPPGRLEKAENGKQVLKDEPGYTDIRIPRGYKQIKLIVNFENPDAIPVSIGFRKTNGEMDLREAKNELTYQIPEIQITSERAQLIISAPALRTGAKPLTFGQFEITFLK